MIITIERNLRQMDDLEAQEVILKMKTSFFFEARILRTPGFNMDVSRFSLFFSPLLFGGPLIDIDTLRAVSILQSPQQKFVR